MARKRVLLVDDLLPACTVRRLTKCTAWDQTWATPPPPPRSRLQSRNMKCLRVHTARQGSQTRGNIQAIGHAILNTLGTSDNESCQWTRAAGDSQRHAVCVGAARGGDHPSPPSPSSCEFPTWVPEGWAYSSQHRSRVRPEKGCGPGATSVPPSATSAPDLLLRLTVSSLCLVLAEDDTPFTCGLLPSHLH